MASILLADDNVELLHLQEIVLRDAGHHVTTATTGAEALRHMRERSFDLVITDIIMPGGDGLETITHLRKCHPHTRIIAISGGGRLTRIDFLPVAEKLGASKTLAKPIGPRELLATVDLVLNLRTAA